jgi:hypothetical protein
MALDVVIDFGSGARLLDPVAIRSFARSSWRTPGARAGLSLGASLLFFLLSNLAEWVGAPMYPKTPAGLVLCCAAAVPFFWNTLAADLLGTAVLFGLDALSRRQRKLAAAGFAAAAFLLAGRVSAQQIPPASEDVVVTATSVPEDEKDVGSAITVVTRQELEKHESVVVSDVLRSVPGLDVVQQGTPGSVTSLFTRGTNSTQTLVLVDGVRMNSPYFAGTVVGDDDREHRSDRDRPRALLRPLRLGRDRRRGPDLHAPGAEGISGRARPETRARARAPLRFQRGRPFSASASCRYEAFNGEGPDTRAPAQWTASLRPGSATRGIGVEWASSTARSTIPGDRRIRVPSSARGFTHEARVSVQTSRSRTRIPRRLLGGVQSAPAYRDRRGIRSRRPTKTLQANVSDTTKLGNHATAFGSWERWKVDDASNFGVNLDGAKTTLGARRPGHRDCASPSRGVLRPRTRPTAKRGRANGELALDSTALEDPRLGGRDSARHRRRALLPVLGQSPQPESPSRPRSARSATSATGRPSCPCSGTT